MRTRNYILFRNVVIIGNALFVLWILRNGMNEGWKGTPLEIVSFIGLILLLTLNTILLFRKA
jgi:hypothetical protein